jgi:solute carrier family 25 uncoupling protein 8/9
MIMPVFLALCAQSRYEPCRDFFHSTPVDPGVPAPFYVKLMAGLTTGFIGVTISNPTDVVKVRLQAQGHLPADAPRLYNGTWDAYRKIVRQDGLVGLWRGYVPNAVRFSVINAAELASYDQIKQTILRASLMKDDVPAHLVYAPG